MSGPVVLTAQEAERICDVLIEMATRLPMKRRNHAEALELLRWRDRRDGAGNLHADSMQTVPAAGQAQP